jgi:uncharacterized protein (TIGR00369 family)
VTTPDTEPPPQGDEPDGLERVHRLVRGEIPLPGMWVTLGMRPTWCEFGRARVEVIPGAHHANGNQIAHGGLVASVIDSAAGAAMSSTLPAGRRIATVDLQVDYHRAVLLDGTPLAVEAEVVRGGRRLGHVRAEVHVGDRLVATGRAMFSVFDRQTTSGHI